ncbi:MAG: hypothetical protein BWX84_01601 [Verrucomicrobia bacterium ADurb.Bin118]|jgi:hypothetical protein|nr:MAG: hypothetical protein BWX84_01601 [Verrucomicrobia bacterium ADurb.Bin118]
MDYDAGAMTDRQTPHPGRGSVCHQPGGDGLWSVRATQGAFHPEVGFPSRTSEYRGHHFLGLDERLPTTVGRSANWPRPT